MLFNKLFVVIGVNAERAVLFQYRPPKLKTPITIMLKKLSFSITLFVFKISVDMLLYRVTNIDGAYIINLTLAV